MSDEYLREDALVWEVPVPTQVASTAWQPYLKGFNGEIGLGLTAEMGTDEIFKFLWVDQTLKQQITGSK